MTPEGRWSVLTRPPPSCWRRPGRLCRPSREFRCGQDYEYRREGTRNLFLACEPLAGWRHVAVTQRRTMQDFAHRMRWLVDEAYPEAQVGAGGLGQSEHPSPGVAVRDLPGRRGPEGSQRLEFHYTPKHGSWLNMAEIEFSVLSRCCLKQRLPNEEALRREVHALVAGAQRRRCHHKLAVQHPRRQNQAPSPLSL